MLIYCVDDDPDWQKYYSSLLRKTNKVECFADGVSAIEAIDEQIPDAIVLDMLLVGPNGVSLLAELQSYPDLSEIPVAVVSGVEISDDLANYGVSRVFNKANFAPQELLAWIQKLAR